VARVLGGLAGVLERWDEAEAHYRSAAELCTRLGSRPWLAYCQISRALMLRRRGLPGDADQAAALLAEGSAIAGKLDISLHLLPIFE
jgi:hypothetical protein